MSSFVTAPFNRRSNVPSVPSPNVWQWIKALTMSNLRTNWINNLLAMFRISQTSSSLAHFPSLKTDDNGKTPLIIAAQRGLVGCVKALLENKGEMAIDINETDANGYSALHWASLNGHLKVCEILLDSGAQVDHLRYTALFMASFRGHMPVVKELVRRGASLDFPLCGAAEGGRAEVMQYLLERGADMYCANVKGVTCVQIAVAQGNVDVLKVLVDNGAIMVQESGTTSLHLAAFHSNVDAIKYLVGLGALLEARDGDNLTPLLVAAKHSTPETILALIELGANLHSCVSMDNEINLNALGLAIGAERDDEVVKTILEHMDLDGLGNAVIAATTLGSVDHLKMLLDYGAPVDNNQTFAHFSLLFYALGDMEKVKLLMAHGVKWDTISDFGSSPIHAIVSVEVLTYFVELGCNVNGRNNKGYTPIIYATAEGIEEVKYLYERGADVYARGNKGRSLLQEASRRGNREVMEFLLSFEFDIEERDFRGRTPLLIAAQKGNQEGAKVLLERGAKWDITNNIGKTPLSLACENGNTELIQCLESAIFPSPPDSPAKGCAICLEDILYEYKLPCKHGFCLHCVVDLQKNCGDKEERVRCPCCRLETGKINFTPSEIQTKNPWVSLSANCLRSWNTLLYKCINYKRV